MNHEAQSTPTRTAVPSQPGESPSAEGESTRLVWIDALRSLSIFAVILLHSAAPLLLRFGDEEASGSAEWWIGNLYDSSVRWSVPIFVMVSGALLLGRAQREGLGEFFRRRLSRVAIPFLAWSVLYFQWQIWFWDSDQSYGELLPMLVREPVAYHLWFVYMLLGLYFLAPLLGAIFAVDRWRLPIYAVGLWLFWAGLLPLLGRLLEIETWYSPDRDNSPLMLVGYFILGFLLRDVPMTRTFRLASPLVFLASVAATAGLTFWLTRAAGGEYQPLFYEYYGLNVVLMAVAVFFLGAGLPGLQEADGDTRRARFWRFLSDRAFGVYLVHVLILDLLKEGTLGWRLDHLTFHPAVSVPLLAVVVFVASLILVLFLERIPLIRRVLL
ncbi:MAG: acyltransferase family protein [Acidobacteriota bacterium]|nr:acyltransferase family protein [Acidobacteriota bacterium]